MSARYTYDLIILFPQLNILLKQVNNLTPRDIMTFYQDIKLYLYPGSSAYHLVSLFSLRSKRIRGLEFIR